MSKVVDQRVVEMQFDNKDFEKNVANTVSTLEKLKSKLNFSGSAKGLEDVSKAAKNVNMSGIASGIETVTAKFSSMQVVGVTALANLTNSAVNAGKRMVKALTLDPVTTGFNEYETKINAIQTIMSNTASKGTTMADVTRVIGELNEYADKTIYNFAEMTRNIGTFTAAGVGLEESAAAIQGIANLAAASGSTSQQASTAMYQLSQALSSGTVKLMDWNSVVNAGMGGEKFQEALKATAREHGIAVDEMIEEAGSFRDSLQKEWITAEILNTTLQKFTTEGAKAYADAMVQSGKYTEEQAAALKKEAQAMEDAATKVKTFTQLWDTMKESVQSGWAQTWEILFGNFEEAKEFFSELSATFGKVIDTFSNVRNGILSKALTSKWDQLTNKINAAGISTDVFESKITETLEEAGVDTKKLVDEYGSLSNAFRKGKIPADTLTKSLKKLIGVEDKVTKTTENMGRIVDEVIDGKWGKGQERWDALAKAGYDWAEIQTEVNKKLGSSITHISELTSEQKKNAEQLSELSDEQLKNKGYTEEQIEALRELKKAAEEGGTSINELIEDMEKPGGRELLIDSVRNIIKAFEDAFNIIADAWNNIFNTSVDGSANGIYTMIEHFHELTEAMQFSEDEANTFKTVMEGCMAALNISWGVFKGGLKGTINLVKAVLGLFGTDLGKVLEFVANQVINLHDWIKANTMLINPIDKLAQVIHAVLVGIRDVAKAFLELEIVQDAVAKVWEKLGAIFGKFSLDFNGFSVDGIVDTINNAFHNAIEWIKSLDSNEAARNFILGLINGIGDGIAWVVGLIIDLGKAALDALMTVWDEHSPSKATEEIGENFMVGLWRGIKEFCQIVWNTIKVFADKCLVILEKVDFGKIFAAGVIAAALLLFKKMVDIVEMIVSPVKAVTDMLNNIGGAFKTVAGSISTNVTKIGDALEKNIKAKTWESRSKVILNFGIAIGIMAASMWVLSKVPWPDLIKAGVAIAALAGIMAGLIIVAGKMNKAGEVTVSAGAVLAIAASLVLVAHALNKLSDIPLEQVPSVLLTMGIAVAALLGIVVGFAKLATPRNEALAIKMGWILLQISAAFYVMVKVIKLAAGLNGGEIASAVSAIAQVSVIFLAVIAVSKLAGKYASKAGSMLLKMSIAIGIMVAVVKVASMLDQATVNKGMSTVGTIGIFFAAVIAVSKLAGQYSSKAGSMMLKMSAGLVFMVGAIAIIALMDQSDIDKALVTISKLSLLFAGLIAVSYFAGQNASKAGTMLFLISGAMLVLAGVLYILSTIDPSGLERAVAAVSVLMIIFGGLIAVTSLAKECKLTMITLAVVVGLLAMSLALLSFIEPKSLQSATMAISSVMAVFAGLIVATKFAKNSKAMVRTLATLIVIAGILAALVWALTLIKDPGAVAQSVQALSVLMLTFAGTLLIMGKVGRISTTVTKMLAPLTLVTAGLALILTLMSRLSNPDALIPSAVALSILLTTLAASIAILSKTGPSASLALAPLAIMTAIVAGLALILGLLTTYAKNVDSVLPVATGLSILLLALSAACLTLAPIGAAGPAVITGAVTLAAVVALLAAVMITLGAIMDNMSPEAIEKCKSGITKLMDLFATLAYGIGDVLGSFVGGFMEGALSWIPELGKQLSEFMTNAMPFITGAKMIDKTVVDGMKGIAQTILILTAADVLNGLTSFFGTKTSLSEFGKELEKFGPSLAKFAIAVSGVDGSSISASAEAAKDLAEMAAALPNSGGLAGFFAGENDMSKFGPQLVSFGTHLRAYGTAVSGLAVEAINDSVDAAKGLANMASAIPNLGGMISWFTGENDIETFGVKMVSFGRSIAEFSSVVAGKVNVGSITAAAEAGQAIANLAAAIPNSGGIASWFTGDNTLTGFAEDIAGFVFTLNQLNVEGVNKFSKALTELGKTGINDLIDGFSGATNDIKNAVIDAIDTFINTIDGQQYRFEDAGEDLVDGFAEGITDRTWKAEAKARAMAKAAAKAAEEALDINSPSKVFRAIGTSVPEGFAVGIDKMRSVVVSSAIAMANAPLDSVKEAIAGISNAISSDIDAQPTIRPVLDLSNIKTGAAAISGLFGSPVGTLSTAGNINMMMNRRNQNGANSDVVSAIDKLNKKLDNAGNTYNSINGINISGDSDLDDAFQTIVRYAKLERRV